MSEVEKTRVAAVMLDMERHCLGHEGMEDSPVARWARELRYALKSDTSDAAEDVSMSAYDLLPEEDREAIAWVREHGGVCGIERTIASLHDHVYRRQRQIDESHEALRRRNARIAELERQRSEAVSAQLASDAALYDLRREVRDLCEAHGIEPPEGDLSVLDEALSKRLMPEGMAWLLYVWPRFEDGEPVLPGASAPFGTDDVMEVTGVEINNCGYVLHGSINDGMRECVDGDEHGVAVKRPAPKVLDADGAEVHRTDKVWLLDGSGPYTVDCNFGDGDVSLVERAGIVRADQLTHERPDSWERLEEDATKNPFDYCKDAGIDVPDPRDGMFISDVIEPFAKDLVRRAKALAERDA